MFEFIRRFFRKRKRTDWYAAERDRGIWFVDETTRERAIELVRRNGASIIGIDEVNHVIFYEYMPPG
jgi:hypothetical protein